MPVLRGFDIAITTSADTSGVEKARAAVDQAKAAVDRFRAASAELAEIQDRMQSNDYGFLPPGQLDQDLARLQELQTEIKGLENAEATLAEQTKKLGQEHERTNEKVKTTGNSFNVTREKGVMLGNMAAGLATQFGLGADATQLMASGMTNLAMIMSTGGPWGIAAGFVLQTLTALTLKWKQFDEAAEKATQAELSKMTATVAELNNAKVAQEEWANSVKHTIDLINLQTSALERQQKVQTEERERAAKQSQEQREDDERERQERLEDGKITEDDIRSDKIAADANAMREEELGKQAEIEKELGKAQREKAAAQEEFQARESKAREAEEKYAASRDVAQNDFQIQKATKQRELAKKALAGMDEEGIGDGPLRRLVERKLKEADEEISRSTTQNHALEEQYGQFDRDEKTGQVDRKRLKERMEAERKAADEALPGLYERDQAAQAEIEKREREREDVNRHYGRERDAYRRKLAPEDQPFWDRMNESPDDEAARYRQMDFNRKREDDLRRYMPEEAKRKAASAEGDLSGALGKLADAAQKGSDSDRQKEEMIRKAAKAMEDGAQGKEMGDAAQAIIQAASTNNATVKALAAAARQALEIARQAQRAVADLQAAAKATN